MKTIGIFHYKVGGTDGVSLEIEKWKQVLEEMGHTVHLCAGDLGAVKGTLIEEMYHHRDDAERLNFNTFCQLRDYKDEAAYKAEMEGLARVIERKLRRFVTEKGVDFLLPQNVWSFAASPPVAIALARVMRDLQLPTLAHHHDFYWERVGGVALTCGTAVEVADKALPPRNPLIQHVVINSLAQQELLERKGLEASVVPNVFDFDAPPWQLDSYNQDFRSRIGLRKNDVLVLQATRIVQRKGIEQAVDFVKALGSRERRARLKQSGLYDGRPFDDEGRIVLVLAGYSEDPTERYLNLLRQKIERAGIDALFVGDLVAGQRGRRGGEKIYSLWDTYVLADFVTYPSLWEGWGNQFLEALRARLPLMLFEYPVYRADIRDKGFRVVSLGDEIQGHDDLGLVQVEDSTIEAAADQAVALLTDAQLRRETVEHNFELGRQYYSLAALRSHLARLVTDF
ncbi:MAG: glycosyltransferase family 4 protein [Anaerolineae bacterium]|nr:MAG: glycosyltransferase family 4 protein [Anaerolineae bacterium]